MAFPQDFTITRDFDKEKDDMNKKYNRSMVTYWLECYQNEAREALKSLEQAKYFLQQL